LEGQASILPGIELVFTFHNPYYFPQLFVLIKFRDCLSECLPSLGSWPFLLSEWENRARHDIQESCEKLDKDPAKTEKERRLSATITSDVVEKIMSQEKLGLVLRR